MHISTEGPIGWAARALVPRSRPGCPTPPSFHTRFPDYLAVRTRLPASLFWQPLRRFHRPASAILVATPTLAAELRTQGLAQTRPWSRGVDLTLFGPDGDRLPELANLPRPIQLHVGRVAPEKNIEAFLQTNAPGTKVVVGDGPALASLRSRFPEAVFLGALHGERLAAAYRSADVFVFPSRTDTFGLVMIEALASGAPVAAFPVPGPVDIVTRAVGALDERLERAIAQALTRDRGACVELGQGYSWARSTAQFLNGLAIERPQVSREDIAAPVAAWAERELAAA